MELLNKAQIREYVYNSKLIDRSHEIEVIDVLQETDETEGLVNQIFRIRDPVDKISFVIKQILPFALAFTRVSGEYHYMDARRIVTESRALTFLETFWEGIAPRVYRVDGDLGLVIMEDLTEYKNLRYELPKAHTFPYFGIEIGSLLAGLRYYTSNLYLDESACKDLEEYFCNAYHRERMADMVMGKDNITRHPEKYEPGARPFCEEIKNDQKLQGKITEMRNDLVEHPNCFCHMDMHIGNVLVDKNRIKLVDSEFSGYGTTYMDLGRIASSFLINFFSWLLREDPRREEMLAYDKQMIYDLFKSYEMTLLKLAPNEAEEIYRDEELKSIRLMAISLLMRAHSGIALSHDLAILEDADKLTYIQNEGLKLVKKVFDDDSYTIERIIDDLDRLQEQ